MRLRRRLAVWSALALVVAALASGAGGANGAGELTFYPQAGILWQDLYPANFVDLDQGPGLRDFACGTQTYDGHTGIDTTIRSFREMDIGVPVFAALDGRVLSVQDGEFDRNFGPRAPRFDNHVVVEHGTGRFTIYGHLRKGIKLKRNDKVVAGQQIGWTASSGNSSWPHLHFTSQVASEIDEPFAGPCNEGPSGWADQPTLPTTSYARDVTLSEKPFTNKADLPYDRANRTGTFVAGTRTIHARIEFGLLTGGERLRIRVLRPDGSSDLDQTPSVSFAVHNGLGRMSLAYRLDLRPVGQWRLVVDVSGRTVADAPFLIVAGPRDVRNRPPNPISAEILPAIPAASDVVQCRVHASLVTEDPDYDIVRYRYRWSVGGKVVRAVQSAALSDVLRKGLFGSGAPVRCTVTPSDGRLSGATVTAAGAAR
jgi:murein DD-endopeptidase MepM/ murein hydrolase activator NlpD